MRGVGWKPQTTITKAKLRNWQNHIFPVGKCQKVSEQNLNNFKQGTSFQ